MRQVNLTNYAGTIPKPGSFDRWVSDNLNAFANASQIDVITGVKASGAALSTLNNAANNQVPIYTGATSVTFLTLSSYFVGTLATLNSAAAWLSELGGTSGAGYLQTANNLSELTGTASTARTNLGLGSAAIQSVSSILPKGTASGGYLGEIASAGSSAQSTARTNLALGAAATQGTCLLAASNLSDVPTPATARTNLGVAYGKRQIFIDAASMMTANTTAGASPASGAIESTTNKEMNVGFDFVNGAIKYVQFRTMLPKSWDQGTVTAQFWFYQPTAGGSGNVVFGMQAVAVPSGNQSDTFWGFVQEVTTTVGTSLFTYASAATPAITVAGTLGNNVPIFFRIYRDGTNASDTYAATMRLVGCLLTYNTNANNDS